MFAPLVERWGGGPKDDAPPILEASDAAGMCRQQALRLSWEALSQAELALSLGTHFASARPDTPQARLVRVLSLLGALVAVELRRLQRQIRCEAHEHARWQTLPSGGRVDALASLQRAQGAPPQSWLVRRTSRHPETPVNRLLAFMLHDVRTGLDRLRDDQHLPSLLRREGAVLARGSQALRAFLAQCPIGDVDPQRLPPLDVLWREAQRRQAELRRVSSFIHWWQELCHTRLERLVSSDKDGAPELPTPVCFEMAVALSLVLRLRERLRLVPDVAGPRFCGSRGEVSVRLGERPAGLGRGRGATLVLHVRAHHAGAQPAMMVVEARNAGGLGLGRIIDVLDLWTLAGSARRAVIVAPVVPDAESATLRTIPCPAERLADLRLWDPIVDEITKEIDK